MCMCARKKMLEKFINNIRKFMKGIFIFIDCINTAGIKNSKLSFKMYVVWLKEDLMNFSTLRKAFFGCIVFFFTPEWYRET